MVETSHPSQDKKKPPEAEASGSHSCSSGHVTFFGAANGAFLFFAGKAMGVSEGFQRPLESGLEVSRSWDLISRQ